MTITISRPGLIMLILALIVAILMSDKRRVSAEPAEMEIDPDIFEGDDSDE